MLSRAVLPLLVFLGSLPVLSTPAAAQVTGELPGRIIKVVEFADRGRIYTVNVDTGRVSFVDVAPQPEPQPEPKPPIVAEKAAWVTLLVAPYDPAQRAWLTDTRLRQSAATAGIQFRAFSSTEEDVDTLGFRRLARENTIPCVIVQDKDGKVILSRKVTGVDDVISVIGGGK